MKLEIDKATAVQGLWKEMINSLTGHVNDAIERSGGGRILTF